MLFLNDTPFKGNTQDLTFEWTSQQENPFKYGQKVL